VPPSSPLVLAIDPGTAKCGIAVVTREGRAPRVLHREIAETSALPARIAALLPLYPALDAVLIGNATNGARLTRELRTILPADLPLHAVPEAYTSQRARDRYRLEHPPRGLQRLVPVGLRTPPLPYDDYVAVILAEDWLTQNAVEKSD